MLNTYSRSLFFPTIILFSVQISFAQSYKIIGKVVDGNMQSPLAGAYVVATNFNDSLNKSFSITKADGTFQLDHLAKSDYRLAVSFVGYKRSNQIIQLISRNQSVGTIPLALESTQLKELTIVANTPPAILKGDTTEFNAAAFKVITNANVEDLVKKIPGVTVEDGTVKAQGEEVKKVLVDGKIFFGDDPSIALKNLPAEIVDKVQVFDEQSDQSKLTGFNDGQTSKTMNIVTRKDKRIGYFGKAMAAYGDQNRYSAGCVLNKFNGAERLSAIVSSNNVNQQNFGTQDFLGAMGGSEGGGRRRGGELGESTGRSGGGGGMFGSGMQGTQSGLSTISSIGLNYSNTFNSNFSISGSYFFNKTKNENIQLSNTEYILSSDSSRVERSNLNSASKNYNNRLNVRAEWSIDSMNMLIIVPSVNFQSNTVVSSSTESQSIRVLDADYPQYSSLSLSNTTTDGYNISNRATYRHRFKKTRRSFSIDQSATFNRKEPSSTSISDVDYIGTSSAVLTDRNSQSLNEGYTFTTNLAYTEPIGKISMIQLNAKNSYSETYAYKKTSDLDTLINQYFQVDTLSNKYRNHFMANCVGLSYLLRTDKLMASAGFEVQSSDLSGKQRYPLESTTEKHFSNILPNFQLKYRLSQQQSLSVNYNTSTNPPTINQLQNVAEYTSNLTKVTIGNPDLVPQYQHNISARLMYVNRDKGCNVFFLLGSTISENSIGSSVTYLDTIQITKPVNFGTGYTLRSMANYGFYIKFLRCNMNISSGYNFNKTPGFINGKDNVATTHAIFQSFVINSNISEKIDFTISTSGNYTIVDNSLASSNDYNYYSQNSSLRFRWVFWNGFTFQNDIANKFYKGMSSGYNQGSTLINVGIGKKIFKNEAGELNVTVYDLLNNNSSVSRTVTANQIVDQESKALNRYVLASFTYTFRNFKSGEMPKRQHHRSNNFGGTPPIRNDFGDSSLTE